MRWTVASSGDGGPRGGVWDRSLTPAHGRGAHTGASRPASNTCGNYCGDTCGNYCGDTCGDTYGDTC
eukprot:1586127-Pyramimonas_sp.AAC.1